MENNACSFCGSKRCAKILYGRIAETKQLRENLEAGKVVLGGCLVYDGMHQWRCLDCGKEWSTSLDNNQDSE